MVTSLGRIDQGILGRRRRFDFTVCGHLAEWPEPASA
jgi:hypothetical protein